MDLAAQLESHPLFEGFSPEALARIVELARPVTYAAGDVCIQEGEASEVFGVLISGRLEVVRGRRSDQPERIGMIEPGECFGEMSMLTGNSTVADVVATEPAQAVIFVQEQIAPLLATHRQSLRFLTKLMASRLAPARGRSAARPRRAEAVAYTLGASAPMKVLAVSCRPAELRYSLFDTTSESPRATGYISKLYRDQAVHVYEGPDGPRGSALPQATHQDAMTAAIEALTAPDTGVIGDPSELSVVAHRVCHGGPRFNGPAEISDDVKQEIRRLADVAPMDNPYNLRGIEACEALAGTVPQVAVFDTAFHLRMPAAAQRCALPADLGRDPLLRRYGFHGISHEGAARAAAEFLGVRFDSLRIVSCHMGNSASLSAIDHGRPADNTMGFSPLEGLAMATRSGDLDPALVLHLVRRKGLEPDELLRKLYDESGLLGMSGISGDMLSVLGAAEKGNPAALMAIEALCHRARKHLNAFVGLLGGADAIVFTGGVAQNAPGLRARICQGLAWMGIVLDEDRNADADVGPGQVARVSADDTRAKVLVVGSNEEHTIACQAVRAIAQKPVTDLIRRQHKAIPLGVSAHHVHLTPEHVEALFGPGHTLTWYADLTQPGQFACKEQVTLVGPKGRIERVRVLGPERPESQVEIARTEEFKLGVDAPIRMSGDLDGTPGITLEGPAGSVHLDHGVICAMRHIHMSPQDALELAVRDRDVVRVRVPGERSLIFGDVMVRVSPDFRLDMHVDTDEANAAELDRDAVGHLDSIQERASA